MKRWSKPLKFWKTHREEFETQIIEEVKRRDTIRKEMTRHHSGSFTLSSPVAGKDTSQGGSSVSDIESIDDSIASSLDADTSRRNSITVDNGGIFDTIIRPFTACKNKLIKTNDRFHLLFKNKWYIMELRQHFGEKVGFYFAYTNFYTKTLIPLTLTGILMYVIRFISWKYYVMILSLYGWGTATVWAPSFLLEWSRRKRRLQQKWSIQESRQRKYPNPLFREARIEKKIIVRCRQCRRLIKSLRFSENPNEGIYPEHVDAVCKKSAV